MSNSHINDRRRTQGHKGHSSKPTTFHGIEGESQRYMHEGPAGHTRRHEKLFPGQRRGHFSLHDKFDYLMGKHKGQTKRYNAYLKAKEEHEKAHGKTGGRRRGRKSRSTRRR
jgi:hypothetical protein